jgi:hypothetical protein
MKTIKKLTIAIILLSTSLSFAQWQKKEYVDDFGDKTGEYYKYLITENGTFTNSATQNSKLAAKFVLDEKSLSIYVLEYGSNLANGIDHTFENVKIKDPSNKIHEIKRVFFTKSGILYFSKKQYNQITEILKQKGDYTMIFNRTSNYSISSYRLKFTIENE